MKNAETKLLLLVALLSFFSLTAFAQTNPTSAESQGTIFPKGKRVPSENFAGTVWVQTLVPDDSTFNCVVSNVTFEPGARSNRSAVRWHSHPVGQILLVTDGTGYCQERGKSIQVFHKGDVVKCLPGGEHWHGASTNSQMTHVAVNANTEKGVVVWLKRVTDEEYNHLK